MRVTNQMMSNNTLSNINKNKISMSKLEEQYSTGKKIQRPSDDPVVAVRALKLRKNLNELNQYYEKNIPDAKSWMDITESALKNITDILTTITGYCNQGATDTLTAENRQSVLANIQQLTAQIYEEGNSNSAGRYVFTGYKTDTGLIFDQDVKNTVYNINQEFRGNSITATDRVIGGYSADDYTGTGTTIDKFATSPTVKSVYSIQTAYTDLDNENFSLSYKYVDGTGKETEVTLKADQINQVSSKDKNAYDVADDQVNFIKETGEIIIGKNLYETMKNATSINVGYQKSEFAKGDVRPEMYFDCTKKEYVSDEKTGDPIKNIEYKKEDQEITYEINFNQSLVVNTQASDAIPLDIKRQVDAIAKSIQDVTAVEGEIAQVQKMIDDPNMAAAEKEKLNALMEQLKTELSLKTSVMQKEFGAGLTVAGNQQQAANIALADLGSRYVRLELTEDRLSSQQTDFEDLLSTNEDADMVETIVKYNSQNTIYNASLSAAAKIAKNSLLDFI